MNLNTRSKSWKWSLYDFYSTFRDVVFFIIAALVANIEAFEVWLNGLGLSTFLSTVILWAIIELGRKLGKNYTKK